jgi:hypothetical protein
MAAMMVLGSGRVGVCVEVALAVGSIVKQPVMMAANSKASVVCWSVGVRRKASPKLLQREGRRAAQATKRKMAAVGIRDVDTALASALLAS